MGRRCWTERSVTLVLLALVASVGALPASYVLLPVSSFANNASLIAGYDCSPTYASTPCSGHGICYLLLDSTAALSLPYLNASTMVPLAASSSSLDVYNVYHLSVPAAVCVCDSGWTGRGDYIHHYALDGDSCGISSALIVTLNVVGIVLFVPLLLLAVHRLHLWSLWHATATQQESAVATPTAPDDPSMNDAAAAVQQSQSTNVALSNQRLIPISLLSARAVASPPHPQPVAVTASCGFKGVFGFVRHVNSSDRQRRALLKAHLSHISFLHPLCSLLFAATSLGFFCLRLFTDQTVGVSYGMSLLVYVNHIPFICCVTMGVVNTLQVCGAIIGRQRQHLLTLINTSRRYLGLLAVYGMFSFVIVFLVHTFDHRQQLMAQLVLLLCWAPDFLLLGPLSVGSFIRLLPALIADVEKLSGEQQAARLAVYSKLRSFSYLIGFLVIGNLIAILILAASPTLRQTGLPVYLYFWYYSAYGFIVVRLILLQTPKTNQPQHTAAVSPAPATREKAASRATADGLEVATLNGGGHTAVEAGLGGWTERSKQPPGMRAMTSSRIDEGEEASSQRAGAVQAAQSSKSCHVWG